MEKETDVEKFTVSFITVIISSMINGLLLWVLYPYIFTVFPNAASIGILASNLSFWDCMCLIWLIKIFAPAAK